MSRRDAFVEAPCLAASALSAGAEVATGREVEIRFDGRLCIHARYCVTGAPRVFLANVDGPWIHPDEMDGEDLAAIARECPSGAIQYRRTDGGREEAEVNLIRTLEAGPYAFRGDLNIDGAPRGYRLTLCRCGASKNKPFCDSSHKAVGFDASGEPASSGPAEMLAARAGPVDIAPQLDGPLIVRGNIEIISGTGRVIARQKSARLCRCGHSRAKPFLRRVACRGRLSVRRRRRRTMSEDFVRVLGIAGSLRRGSFNRALLAAAGELAPANMAVESFDLIQVPLYNGDVETQGDPAGVAAFKQAIAAADAVLFVTPEYNHGVPGVMKNAVDWASRPAGHAALNGKPVGIIGASPGQTGTARGQSQLRQAFEFTNSFCMPQPEILVFRAHQKFDAAGQLTDQATAQRLRQYLEAFERWTRRLRR